MVDWGYVSANYSAVKFEQGVLQVADCIDDTRSGIEKGLSKLLGA